MEEETFQAALRTFQKQELCVVEIPVRGVSDSTWSCDNVFVITMGASWVKHVYLRHAMAQVGLPYTLCIMAPPPQSLYHAYVASRGRNSDSSSSLLTIGELGSLLSHAHVLEKAAAMGKQPSKILVFEDDIMFAKEFVGRLRTLVANKGFQTSQLTLLGASDWHRTQRDTQPDLMYYLHDDKRKACGAFAYAVGQSWASKLRALMLTLDNPVDHYWGKCPCAAAAYPDLVIPDRSSESTTKPGRKFAPGSAEEATYRRACGIADLSLYDTFCLAAVSDSAACKAAFTVGDASDPGIERLRREILACTWPSDRLAHMFTDLWPGAAKKDLAVCIAYFNPIGFAAPLRNLRTVLTQYRAARVPVFIIQLVYDSFPAPAPPLEACALAEDAVEGEVTIVTVHSSTAMFHKENLWNVGVDHIPPQYTKLLFVDNDIVFTEPHWSRVLSDSLDAALVVQPFRSIALQTAAGEVQRTLASFLCAATHRPSSPRSPWSAPGYAIACQRRWLQAVGGFMDMAIMGGGDALTMAALTGVDIQHHMCWTHQPYAHAAWKAFCDQVQASLDPSLEFWTYAPLHIQHLYHGQAENRQYSTRHDRTKLMTHEWFYKNKDRVWECIDPEYMNAITLPYFAGRKEDD
jgi:hypothetical protein